MAKIEIDTRFSEHRYELNTLEKYVSIVQEIILREQEIENRIKNYKIDKNDPVYSILQQDKSKIGRYLLPKFFINPIVVSLYSITETSLTAVAKYIKQINNYKLNLNDIKGDHFLDQSKKYFNYILDFPILTDQNIYQKFYEIMKLRHLIAHCNGIISNVKSKDNGFYHNLLMKNSDIYLYSDEIVLTESFIFKRFTIIKSELEFIFKTVKKNYKKISE